ncbi:unnamed protein product [Amoebophrya sp. A25]|nr:unnamed protein product [Amoebophrya sp. A25]|eukprot:GSA25T00005132001.1
MSFTTLACWHDEVESLPHKKPLDFFLTRTILIFLHLFSSCSCQHDLIGTHLLVSVIDFPPEQRLVLKMATVSGATSSSAMPLAKDVGYNIRHRAIDNATSVSRLNVDEIIANKHLRAAGAPCCAGRAAVQGPTPVPLKDPGYDPSFTARFAPPGHPSCGIPHESHNHGYMPEWHGSVPSKWMDSVTGRNSSRKIVHTAARNGPADSFTRNSFSYFSLPHVRTDSRRMVGSWVPDGVEGEWKPHRRTVKPPFLINKEVLEGVKWTKKPGYVGKNGYGPDRKLQKTTVTRSHSDSTLTHDRGERVMPGDRWSRTLVRNLENWEATKLGSNA